MKILGKRLYDALDSFADYCGGIEYVVDMGGCMTNRRKSGALALAADAA